MKGDEVCVFSCNTMYKWYIVIARRYTNFVTFLFSWDEEYVQQVCRKKRYANKHDKHSSKLVPKSLQIQRKVPVEKIKLQKDDIVVSNKRIKEKTVSL